MIEEDEIVYISPMEVYKSFSSNPSQWLIVDVRDEDRSIGWIPGSFHLPSVSLSVPIMEKFIETHARKPHNTNLVFHCMYSQNRGVQAAKLCQDVLQSMFRRGSFAHPNVLPRVLIMSGGFKGYKRLFPERVEQ